jgi:hypothetical protein
VPPPQRDQGISAQPFSNDQPHHAGKLLCLEISQPTDTILGQDEFKFIGCTFADNVWQTLCSWWICPIFIKWIFRSNDRAKLANRVLKTSGHFWDILRSQRTKRDWPGINFTQQVCSNWVMCKSLYSMLVDKLSSLFVSLRTIDCNKSTQSWRKWLHVI